MLKSYILLFVASNFITTDSQKPNSASVKMRAGLCRLRFKVFHSIMHQNYCISVQQGCYSHIIYCCKWLLHICDFFLICNKY